MRKLKDLSDSEKSEIINQRKIGITEKEISKKFDISLRQYYNLLKLNNERFISDVRKHQDQT